MAIIGPYPLCSKRYQLFISLQLERAAQGGGLALQAMASKTAGPNPYARNSRNAGAIESQI